MPKGTCSVIEDGERCEGRAVNSRGYCNRHYLRWWRHGDPLGGQTRRIIGTPSERFWGKVDLKGPVPASCPALGACFIWTASLSHDYGIFWDAGRTTLAHIWAWEQVHGALPTDLELHHICLNPTCVNPEHLKVLTHSEHMKLHGTLKTHCVHGHPFDDENTYIAPDGRRRCRACAQKRQQAQRRPRPI